jgi:hypothetical protein
MLVALLVAGVAGPSVGQDLKRACTVQLPRGASSAAPPVYRDCDVDKPAQLRREGRIDFIPPAGVTRTGPWWCEQAEMTVLVDSTGRPEPATARVTATTSPEFAAALIGSLASARFRPAELDGRRVRQVVRYDRGVLVYRMNRLSGSRLSTAEERRQGRC